MEIAARFTMLVVQVAGVRRRPKKQVRGGWLI